MEKILFDIETITPMFLGGSDGEAELRPPSVKAALRFWWRALNGNLPLTQLHEKESKLFGGSGELEGKSKFNISIKKTSVATKTTYKTFPEKFGDGPAWYAPNKRANIFVYLGYGMYDNKNNIWKKYIDPGSKFQVIISTFNKEIIDEIKFVFRVFATFGGLGAKSRNGYGQFNLINMPQVTLSELKKYILVNAAPNFSYFSNEGRLFTTEKKFSNWSDALFFLGNHYRLSKLQAEGKKHVYQQRSYISSPIQQAKWDNVFNRKTKPYFLHINKKNGEFEAAILYLPYYDVIKDKAIYSSNYTPAIPANIKTACTKLNNNLLPKGFKEIKL